MTLAEALLPLYRAYLRRLDEMAARLPAGTAVREATAHADGRLLEGDDGLPRRFDVADAATGETYEVHGASPDMPAAAEVRVGTLPVTLRPGNWEELSVACVFAAPPPAEEAEGLARLLTSFAEVASFGGFAGGGPGKGRLHALRAVALRESEMHAVYDLGSAPPEAVEALLRALAGWSEDRLAIARVRIGGSLGAE